MRPNPILTCLATLSLAPLGAADGLVEIHIPDMEATRARFLESPYGTVWMAPQAATLRDRIAALGTEASADLGFDPLDLVLRSDGLEAVVGVIDDIDDPTLQAQIRGEPIVGPLAAVLDREWETMAVGATPQRQGLAVDGDRLLLAAEGAPLQRLPVSEEDHDLIVRWHRDAIMAAIIADSRPRDAAAVSLVDDLMPSGHFTADFSEDGVHQRLVLGAPPAGLAPVDRGLLATLPAEALSVYAVGMDGAAWWQAHGPRVMNVVAQEMGGDAAAAEEQITAMLGGFGIQNGLAGVAALFDGTALVVVGQGGGLVPSLSIALPRNPKLDNLIGLGMGMAGMLVPGEGQLRFMVLRGMGERGSDLAPGVVVGRSSDHWWVSTDAVFLADYLDGQTGGWNQSAVGSLALSRAGDQASIIGGTDAQALLRTLVPLAAFGSGFFDDGRHIQAIGTAALHLARDARADTVVGQPTAEGGWAMDVRGTVGGLSYASSGQLAIIAAIAIPNLLESRISANEAAAGASLRSGIFTGQETFRAMAHNDLDDDNKGEYGFLGHLAGTDPALGTDGTDGIAAGNLELLGAAFGDPGADINGYRYQVWLSDGEGGALTAAEYAKRAKAGELNQQAINSAEIYYVCYAWPVEPGETGRRVFAITNGGRVLTQPVDNVELPPAWNAIKPDAVEFKDFRNPDWNPW